MAKSKIKIAIDFDGVLVYNPLRIARAPIAFSKEKLLGIHKTQFYIPETSSAVFIWSIYHWASILPAKGSVLFYQKLKKEEIEAHLVTARFTPFHKSFKYWLRKHKISRLFKSIVTNENNEQPHLYKERILKRLDPDFYIEDNWDIVRHLNKKTDIQTLWIYNIIDRSIDYKYKFPYLEKALEYIETAQNERS